MNDPDAPAGRLNELSTPDCTQPVDLTVGDSEASEATDLSHPDFEYVTDEDTDDSRNTHPPANTGILPRTVTLGPVPGLHLLTDYHREDRRYADLHELVTAFDRIRPIWPYELRAPVELAAPATFARRAPTASELAGPDLTHAAIVIQDRTDEMDHIVRQVVGSYNDMLSLVTDVLTGTLDHTTLGNIVEAQYARGALPLVESPPASEHRHHRLDTTESRSPTVDDLSTGPPPRRAHRLDDFSSEEYDRGSPEAASKAQFPRPPFSPSPRPQRHILDQSYEEEDAALRELPTIGDAIRLSTPAPPLAPDSSPSGEMTLSETYGNIYPLDERKVSIAARSVPNQPAMCREDHQRLVFEELTLWIESVPRPHSPEFKDWVLAIKSAFHKDDRYTFESLIRDLERGRLGMVHWGPRSAALRRIGVRMWEEAPPPTARHHATLTAQAEPVLALLYSVPHASHQPRHVAASDIEEWIARHLRPDDHGHRWWLDGMRHALTDPAPERIDDLCAQLKEVLDHAMEKVDEQAIPTLRHLWALHWPGSPTNERPAASSADHGLSDSPQATQQRASPSPALNHCSYDERPAPLLHPIPQQHPPSPLDGYSYDKHPTPSRARSSTRDDPRRAAVNEAPQRRLNACRKVRSPTPNAEITAGQPWLSLSPAPQQFPDAGGWLDSFTQPPPLGTIRPAVLPGHSRSPASSQWSASSPTLATWSIRPGPHVMDGPVSRGPTALTAPPPESPTYQCSSHAASVTFSPASTVRLPRYFEYPPIASPEALRPSGGPHPAPAQFPRRPSEVVTPPAPMPSAPRSTAHSIVYGPIVKAQTPAQFLARHQADLNASEAIGELTLRHQAWVEYDKERREERREQRAALGVGRPAGGLQNLESDAYNANLVTQATRPSAQTSPGRARTAPLEIVRPFGGVEYEWYTPAPGNSGWGGYRPVQRGRFSPPPPAVWPTPEVGSVLRRMQRPMSRVVGGTQPPRPSSSPPESSSATRYTAPEPLRSPVPDTSRVSDSQWRSSWRLWDERHPSKRSPIRTDTPPPPLPREALRDDGIEPPRLVAVRPVDESVPGPSSVPSLSAGKKRPASPDTEERPAKRQSTLVPRPVPTPRLGLRGHGSRLSGTGIGPAPGRSGTSAPAPASITVPQPRLQLDDRPPLSPRQRVPSGSRVPSGNRVSSGDRRVPSVEAGRGKRKASGKDNETPHTEDAMDAVPATQTVAAGRPQRSRLSAAPVAPSAGMAPGARPRRNAGTSTIIDVGRSRDVFQPPEALPFQRQRTTSAASAGPSAGPSAGQSAARPHPTHSRTDSAGPPTAADHVVESPIKRRASTRIKERDAKRQRSEEPAQPESRPSRPRRSSIVEKLSGLAKGLKKGKKDENQKSK